MRDEHGFTLVELLIAASLMIVVLGATLTAVETFQRNSNANQVQNDSQEAARVAVDNMARDLRNAGAAAAGSDVSIGRATGFDFAFQAVDDSGASGGANVRRTQWVRYCLEAAQGRIWRQALSWTAATPPAQPFGATCPDTGVGSRQIVATSVVNATASPAVPLFAFDPPLPASPGNADYAKLTHVAIDLLVNTDENRQRRPTRLTTGVYLRNQADPPTAAFGALASGDGVVYLNASPSSDPRGTALSYRWCDTTGGAACTDATAIGQGLTLSYDAPSGTRSITLTVTNAVGLSDSIIRGVVVP